MTKFKQWILYWLPGWRLLKTGLSVMVCFLLYYSLGINPMLACLSAIFFMREDHTLSIRFGKALLIGNTTGCVISLSLVVIRHFFPYMWVEAITLPIGVMLFIKCMNHWHKQPGIINGSAALLIVYFTSQGHQSVLKAIFRITDIFVGAMISIFINRFVHPKKEEPKTIDELKQDLKQIQKQEADLRKMEQQLQIEIERNEKFNEKLGKKMDHNT